MLISACLTYLWLRTQGAAAASKIQASYRARREAAALRSLHGAHVAKLKEAQLAMKNSEAMQQLAEQEKQAEWGSRLRKEAGLFKSTEGEAQQRAAASYIQTRYRSHRAGKAMGSLQEAHAAELARMQETVDETGRLLQACTPTLHMISQFA